MASTLIPMLTESSEEFAGEGNNSPVPSWIHTTMTIIAFLIFLLSMQQLCSASMDSVIIKYRAGVACSCFTFLIVSISLNFELAKDAEEIKISPSFVLIVRTLMVLWCFIAFILAYWFLVHAVRAAYKSTHGINKVDAPGWIQKFWFIVVCVEEIILFLCYVFAFATMNVLPWKIFLLSVFTIAIVGAGIAMGALIDVQLSIRSAVYRVHERNQSGSTGQTSNTNLTNDDIQIKRLKYGQRILRAITVFAFGIIVGAVINIYLILHNIITTGGEAPLQTSVLDNTGEYLSYVLILDFFNLALLFWTYRGHSINYCCFCCNYSKYATNEYREDEIDTSVLCFLCCGGLIETADDKRQKILRDLPLPPSPKTSQDNQNQSDKDNNQQGPDDILVKKDTNTNLKTIISSGNTMMSSGGTSHRPSDTNMINKGGVRRVTHGDTIQDDLDFKNKVKRQQSQVDTRIRVIIYEFDGVLTGEAYRVFKDRTIETINSMPYDSVSFHFGGPERVIGLRDHFKTLFEQGVKLYIVSKEPTGKLFTILKKLEIVQFFMKVQHTSRLNDSELPLSDNEDNDDENNEMVKKDVHYFERTMADEDSNRALMYGIIGCDNPVMEKINQSLKSFILELVKLKSKSELAYDEIMFVSSNMNLVDHFKQINLCRAIQIEGIGLNDNDFAQIEKRV